MSMKQIFTFILILFNLIGNSQTTILAEYTVTNTYKFENFNKKIVLTDVNYRGYFLKQGHSYLNYIIPSKELIKSDFKILIDEINKNTQTLHLPEDSIQNIIFTNTDSFYVKTGKQKEQTQQFCFYYTVGENKWQILPDTKTIQNFTCQKAILQKNENQTPITIWFAPEINCNGIGVLGLRDVPGLVMEFERNNAKLSELWVIKKLKINPTIEAAQMTLKELDGPCTPRKRISAEQQKNNKKKLDILQQTDF
ncbi:MAG: GLPGLI family protein [Chitinophagaceae bacterium]|nr:MAG: GLPGLI family protein [Chitinophagaceae bacterium]